MAQILGTCTSVYTIKCKRPLWEGNRQSRKLNPRIAWGPPFQVPSVGPPVPWGHCLNHSFAFSAESILSQPMCFSHLGSKGFQKERPYTQFVYTFWIIIMIWARIVLLLRAFNIFLKIFFLMVSSKNKFLGEAPLFSLHNFNYKRSKMPSTPNPYLSWKAPIRIVLYSFLQYVSFPAISVLREMCSYIYYPMNRVALQSPI